MAEELSRERRMRGRSQVHRKSCYFACDGGPPQWRPVRNRQERGQTESTKGKPLYKRTTLRQLDTGIMALVNEREIGVK